LAFKPKKIVKLLAKVLVGFLVLFSAYLLILSGIVFWAFQVKLQKWPQFVYAAPFTLRVGDDIDRVNLMDRLARLGYVETREAIPSPGQWNSAGSVLRIFFVHCPISGQGIATGPVQISLDWKTVRSIKLMRSLEEVDNLVLDPELLEVIPAPGRSAELCRPLPLAKVNTLLVEAILLTEDTRFFSHWGIDFTSIVNALKTNIRAGRYLHGASTITQQLVRMTLLRPEKTLWRKIHEILLATLADALYSKESILESYLNRVYLGHWGSFPVRGVSEASRLFFGKDQTELDQAEIALLAAIIRAPNVIHPYRHPERAWGRRNMVLGLLLKAGKVSREDHDNAVNRPVAMRRASGPPEKAAAFIAMVRHRLDSEPIWREAGPQSQDVLTSLNPIIQREARLRLNSVGPAGAGAHLILADPETGSISALIAPASPKWSGEGGSLETLLPLAVIPALIPDRQDRAGYTLTSPMVVSGRSGGAVTFRSAFSHDRPLLVRKLTASPGPEKIVSVLKEFQVRAKVDANKNVTVEPLTPMAMAQVYSLMATLGDASLLEPEVKVINAPASDSRPRRRVSTSPAAIFMVNHLMRGLESITIRDGNPHAIRVAPSKFNARDKEGIWSLAYRPNALLLVRVPDDNAEETRVKQIVADLLPEPGTHSTDSVGVPDGLVFQKICVQSGLRATSVCPRVIREPFFKGTQPTEWCPYRHE